MGPIVYLALACATHVDDQAGDNADAKEQAGKREIEYRQLVWGQRDAAH